MHGHTAGQHQVDEIPPHRQYFNVSGISNFILYKTKTDMRPFFLIVIKLLTSTLCFSQKQLSVGQKIAADFNGNGKSDTAFLKEKTNAKTKAQSWTVSFSDRNIPARQLGCCDLTLINEGHLNGDRTTELSVFQAPENDCV